MLMTGQPPLIATQGRSHREWPQVTTTTTQELRELLSHFGTSKAWKNWPATHQCLDATLSQMHGRLPTKHNQASPNQSPGAVSLYPLPLLGLGHRGRSTIDARDISPSASCRQAPRTELCMQMQSPVYRHVGTGALELQNAGCRGKAGPKLRYTNGMPSVGHIDAGAG